LFHNQVNHPTIQEQHEGGVYQGVHTSEMVVYPDVICCKFTKVLNVKPGGWVRT
jgi:hypothetical protein